MAQQMLNIRFSDSLNRSFEKMIIFESQRQFALAVNSRIYNQIHNLTEKLFSATELLREYINIVTSGRLVGYPDLLNRVIGIGIAKLKYRLNAKAIHCT